MCHLILLLPAFALPVFWVFPMNTALPLYALISGLSLFIYFKVFRAMRLQVRTGFEGMLGKRVVVVEDINPEGKIRYSGEIWDAISEKKSFSKGEKAIIGGMRGLTLLVEEAGAEEEVRVSKRCHAS